MTDRNSGRARNRFKLVLVPAVSAALLAFGCDRSSTSTRICVDPQGHRLSDGQCSTDDRTPSTFHHWYYVSHGGVVPVGAFVHSGSSSFHSSHGSISRGGFGSSAHSSGHAGG